MTETMTDQEFLCWIYERLEHVNGDSPLVDFIHKLRAIIKVVPNDQITPNISSYSSLESLKKDLNKC